MLPRLHRFFSSHAARNVAGADLVVKSAAVPEFNIEISTARSRFIPVWSRLEFLQYLFGSKRHRVAVCGSFGKSSTATMMRDVLMSCGVNPSYYIGALTASGEGVDLTDSEYSVFEACEYKAELMATRPTSVILCNIHKNHEDCFGSDLRTQHQLFESFFKINQPWLDCIALDKTDPGIAAAPFSEMAHVTFGSPDADYHVKPVGFVGNDFWQYEVTRSGVQGGRFKARWPGEHSARNMAAVIAVADQMGLLWPDILRGLSEGHPPTRRFCITLDEPNTVLVDDNARLPPQIAATIRAARMRWPTHGILVIAGIWGRLYARDLNAFSESLSLADAVLIPESDSVEAPAGGPEPEGADERLAEMIERRGVPTICGFGDSLLTSSIRRFADRPLVILTLGYDSHRETFERVPEIVRKAGRSDASAGSELQGTHS
jgi:UDP-N-acetylmuramate--alanine ligase